MKIKLNRVLGIMIMAGTLVISLDSCLKNSLPNETDFSHLQDHVVLIKGGLTNFSSNNISFSSDTASYTITANLASVNLPKSPVNVTIGVDASLIATYNAANGTNFLLLPTRCLHPCIDITNYSCWSAICYNYIGSLSKQR